MKKIILMASVLMLPLAAEAKDDINPWKQCGIGAMVFEGDQTLAAVSNIVWDLGTTAISSKITTPNVCNEEKEETAKLIMNSLPELEKNAATGNGEYILALVGATNCESVASTFTSELKKEYSKVLADENYANKSMEERSLGMYKAVKSASETAQCNSIL